MIKYLLNLNFLYFVKNIELFQRHFRNSFYLLKIYASKIKK